MKTPSNTITITVVALVLYISQVLAPAYAQQITNGCVAYTAFGGTVPDLSFVNGKPFFSWDHVPVYWHSGNMNGLTDEQINYIASRPFATITLEKYEGIYQAMSAAKQEDKFVTVANKIKAKNPTAQILFFQNTLISFPNYDYHCVLKSNNWLLKGVTGKYVPFTYVNPYPFGSCNNDGRYVMTRTMNIFDFRNPFMRQSWKTRIDSLASLDVFSGIFVDRIIFGNPNMDKDDKWTSLLSAAEIKKWFDGFHESVSHVGDAFFAKNKLVIGNNDNYAYTGNGKFGRMIEIFMLGKNQFGKSAYTQILEYINFARERLVHVHADSCADYIHRRTLAGFLMGACKYSYYMCSKRFEITENELSPLCWKPEYNNKLGAPLGAAKISEKSSGIRMYREFASGTKVFIFIRNKITTTEINSCICWKDAPATCYNGGCAMMESDFKKNYGGSMTKWENDGCAA